MLDKLKNILISSAIAGLMMGLVALIGYYATQDNTDTKKAVQKLTTTTSGLGTRVGKVEASVIILNSRTASIQAEMQRQRIQTETDVGKLLSIEDEIRDEQVRQLSQNK